jgi:hypothetical protein
MQPSERGDRRVAAGLVAVAALAVGGYPRRARAQAATDTSSNAFACMGEAQAFVMEHDVDEIRAECDRWLDHREPQETAGLAARRSCFVAELMQSIGDGAAMALYRRAIAASGEPGYELLLADYLRNIRGPGAPLIEQAERHYAAALAGVRARSAAPGVVDETIAAWATRGLMLTYQQDGLPMLPWRRFPYHRPESSWPGFAVMAGGRIAFDTSDTPVDLASPPAVDDARRFTGEAMFAASAQRKAQPLRGDELQAIARAPRRIDWMVRGRIRASPVGAIDVWYRQSEIHDGQITSYAQPTQFNDVSVSELGTAFTRALDLYPAFDVLLAGDYRRVHRVGVIERAPYEAQDLDQVTARTAVVRFFGPDKVSLAGAYTFLRIPDASGGVIADRARRRTIGSFHLDYALNRFLLAPLRIPSLRLFVGAFQDDETFGLRVVRHRDTYLGLGLTRMGAWDFTVQSTLFAGAVLVQPLDPAQSTGEDPQQSNAQVRTTLVLLRRLIDEDAQPGLPSETLGVQPSMLNAVLTVRHDTRLRGLFAFQNVRVGLELWAKAFIPTLWGTAFLMSAGYENQYFYSIRKDLHIFHLDLRMGW